MKKNEVVTLLVLLFAGAAFITDLLTPSCLAGGAFYAVAVFVSFRLARQNYAPTTAVVCTVLSLAALSVYVRFEPPSPIWPIVLNRVVTIVTILVVAKLGTKYFDLESTLNRVQTQLDQHVQVSTRELGQANQELLTEIEQRQRVEIALGLTEAQFMAVVEGLNLHLLRKDMEGRFTYASPSFCRLVGKTLEEVVGKTDFDLFPDHLAEKYRSDDLRVLKSREKFETIEVHPNPDGNKMYVQVMKTPIFDNEGNEHGIQGLFWDVTKEKNAEIHLRESEARKRAIFESAMDSILFTDQDGLIVEFNRAAEHMFGYQREEVVNKMTVDGFIREDSRERHRENITRYTGAGEMGSMIGKRLETDMVRKNGEWFLAEMATLPIPLQGSTGFAVFLRDITLQKKHEEALRNAKDAAEAANQSKSAFLANMSHEIRTPMNAVIGMTEMVLGSDLTDEQREYLNMVLDSGNSLLMLLNDILDFAKIEAGRLDLERVPFDLRSWLKTTVKSQSFRCEQKGLKLRCELSKSTPNYLIGDPHRLRQVLMNLFSNAIKFTEQGFIALKVKLVAESDHEAELRFEVEDTGIGIAPAKCDAIFEKFEQADNSTTRRFGGTGLGLSISSKLVELMHGQIGVESEQGRGSRFHFTARFGVATADTELSAIEPDDVGVAEPVKHPGDDSGDDDSGLRILLAEDSLVNQKLAVGLLRREGHDVTVANNGKEAFDAYQQKTFDVILMDVQMPEMDGFEATAAIRGLEQKTDTHIPIIAMTAHAMKGDRELCLSAGMDAYVSKPIRAQILFDTIARLMRTFSSAEPPEVSVPVTKDEQQVTE